MQDFFDGRHWALDTEGGDIGAGENPGGDSAGGTEETITVNFSRVVVLKYASVLSKGFRLQVPEPAAGDARAAAQRREAYLLSMMPSFMRAYRRAEHNACKVGYGVIQAVFNKHDMAPEVRMMGEGHDQRMVHEYTFMPGQSRSVFHFRNVPPEDFYPVFTGYDDPNADLWYVIRVDHNRLTAELRERYKVELESTGGWDLFGPDQVEPTCTLLHYWDKEDYYLIAQTVRKQAGRPRSPFRSGGGSSEAPLTRAVLLEHVKHMWGRPPFWIISNVFTGEADPTWRGTTSDIDAIKALNRRFNETLSDAATEIRMHIRKPLVYKSDEPQQDPTAIEFESGAVIPIGAEEELTPLDWQPVPEAVERLLDRYEQSIHHLSFLNEAAFGNLRNSPTGVGMRMAFASMLQMLDLKVPLRVDMLRHLFGAVLAYTERMLAPVQVKRGGVAGESTGRVLFRSMTGMMGKGGHEFTVVDLEASDIAGDFEVIIDFSQVLPFDEIQRDQNEVYKFKSRTQSLRETLRSRGVQDVDRAIDEIKSELEDEVLNPEHVLLVAQARQAKSAAGAGAAPGAPQPSLAAPPSQPAMQEGPPVPLPPTAGTEGEGGGVPGGGLNVPGMPRELAGMGGNVGAGVPTPGVNLGGGGMG